jgi:hypothetical protein
MKSQDAQILSMLKKNKRKGVANYEFPAHRILRYSARIDELRKDGHNITCTRDYLPNGRATNVFRYHLVEDE